ncbi:uncharacterized protein TNCV_2591421 [Trichonephila clavipes]|nr:uncharacterized protein TNCV_2591421 [Trichonephila clavipes]
MASAVLVHPTRALQGTNRGSGLAMKESKNDVGSLEQFSLYADEPYLAGKLTLGDHLGNVLNGIEEYHQRNVGPLRFHASQLKWTGYHRPWPSQTITPAVRQCDVEQCAGNCTVHQGASTPVHGSAQKGCLELRFASARCLEIVCGTIATPTSARIVEPVNVGFTSACRMILRSSLLVVFLVAPDPVFRAWIPSRVHCSQQFLTAHSERSTCPGTRCVDQPAVFIPMFGLAIHQNDHQARRRFVEWAQNEIAVVPDFQKRILFSDEAPFWLNGYVNKQNCRIWSEANPQVYVETPLHPEKLTVWCALWAGGILLQKR